MGKKKQKKETEKLKAKLEKAYHFRDFEIDMYWKRAQYFWGFLAVIYAGFFLLLTNQEKYFLPQEYKLITCSMGIVMSFAWYLVNRGSKRWQEHWEDVIKKYEIELNFIVYGEKVDSDFGWIKAGSFSVSKINILMSLIIFISWITLFLISMNSISSLSANEIIFGLITFFALILITVLSKSQV